MVWQALLSSMAFSILSALFYRYLVLIEKTHLLSKRTIMVCLILLHVFYTLPSNIFLYFSSTADSEGVWNDASVRFPDIYAYAKDKNCFGFSIKVTREYVSDITLQISEFNFSFIFGFA